MVVSVFDVVRGVLLEKWNVDVVSVLCVGVAGRLCVENVEYCAW